MLLACLGKLLPSSPPNKSRKPADVIADIRGSFSFRCFLFFVCSTSSVQLLLPAFGVEVLLPSTSIGCARLLFLCNQLVAWWPHSADLRLECVLKCLLSYRIWCVVFQQPLCTFQMASCCQRIPAPLVVRNVGQRPHFETVFRSSGLLLCEHFRNPLAFWCASHRLWRLRRDNLHNICCGFGNVMSST